MSRGRRYNDEPRLNYAKVFGVLIALVVIIVSIFMLKKVLIKAKDTKVASVANYFALYQDGKWGIVGSDGEIVINPMYQEMPIVIDSSKDVFLCTYDINEETGSYKTKVVNKNNEQILTDYDKVEALENYDSAGNVWYEQNALKVEKDGLWGLINLTGNEITPVTYTSIETLKGVKSSILVKNNDTVGLVNEKGKKILDTEYDQILSFGDNYKNGYITVNQENKYGVVNSLGEKILDNEYEKIDDIYSEKYFVIEENGTQKLIDKNKETLLSEGYDEIKQIANSGVVYISNGKYGVMDFTGNVLIDATYDNLQEINTDVFLAQKDGKIGVIDIKGEEKIAFSYKDITCIKKAGIYIADNEDYTSHVLDSNFSIKLTGIISEINTEDGYLKIKTENEYKYYNFKFEEKKIQDILIVNKIFVSFKDGKYGYVDNKGNVVVDYIYDDATEVNKYGYAAVKKDGKWGSINSEGKVVIEPCYNLDNNLVIDFIGKWHLGLDLNMNYYCEIDN